MSESDAIARLKGGDLAGLETLVRMYQPRAVETAYLIVRDAHLAEDVAEDAFLRACERIHQFDPARPFGPWLLRIVINLAKRAAARRERGVSFDAPGGDGKSFEDRLADLAPGLEEQAEQGELRGAVWAALGQLSPEQRAAVVQRYYLEMSEREIAESAGSPLGTIKWRLHAARERLRDWLQPIWRIDHE